MKTFDIEEYKILKQNNKTDRTLEDGSRVLLFDAGNEGIHKSYIEIITPPKPRFFQTYNMYYSNGNLKLSGLQFPNNFLAGIEKEYDEQGKLIKETDYDAPYKFTWEDILELIKKLDINMEDDQFIINRSFGYGTNNIDHKSERPFWAITYDNLNKIQLNVLIIDGISGMLIDSYQEDYPFRDNPTQKRLRL